MATIITVTSRKGGVGKTSIATSLASLLAKEGESVLLVDADPQSSAALALGVDPLADGTAHWLSGRPASFQEVQFGLRLLAGNPALEQFSEDDIELFKKRLDQVEADIVVVDTAAGSGAIGRVAAFIADIALVVSEPHPLGLSAATTIIDGLVRDKIHALVLSRVDPKKSLHREIEEGAPAAFPGARIFSVRTDTRLERALAMGKPASRLSNKSRGKVDIEHIAEWVVNLREA